jgi:hypothetical protein
MGSRWLAAVPAGVALVVAWVGLAEAAPGPGRLRVAVALEPRQRIALPADFGEAAATHALAVGVREACLPPGAATPRAPAVACAEMSDAAGSGVCADETAAQALSVEIACGPGDSHADVIELTGAACDDVACFEAEATRRGATHLLLVHGAWVDGFVVGGTLRALAGPGAVALQLPGSYNRQRPRTGPQVLGILKWAARTAVAEELRRAAMPPASVAPKPVIVAAQPAPTPSAVEERSGHAVLGWTLVGAGVVAGAAGAWLLAINGQGVSCSGITGDPDPCARERRTLIPGASVTVGAAVALVAGVIVLVRDGHDRPPRLAAYVHPEGLMLGGSF